MPRTDSINFDYWRNRLDQQMLDEMLADIEAAPPVLKGDAPAQYDRVAAPLPLTDELLTNPRYDTAPCENTMHDDTPLVLTGQGDFARAYTPEIPRGVERRRASILRWAIGLIVAGLVGYWRFGW